MRPPFLALAFGAAAAACSPEKAPSCPGDAVASLALHGTLAHAGDVFAVPDPVPDLPDCTFDPASPDRYPDSVELDATLAHDPDGAGAALCRPNGVVYAGARTGASQYLFSAEAESAVLCSSTCAAALRVVITGELALDASGAPPAFRGVLVEVLTASRGACDACLPLVPGSDPPEHACAGRYTLTPRDTAP